MLSPKQVNDASAMINVGNSSRCYVRANFTNLHFSGYTEDAWGKTKGYYYYTVYGDKCIIVLLSPGTCDEGLPVIEELSVRGKVVAGGKTYDELLSNLSSDIEWTPEGLTSQMSRYYFSEPDYHAGFTLVMFILYFGTFVYAVLSIILYMIYINFPVLSPTCQNLIVFNRHPHKVLEEAEEELATLPQLATEDMFITEHYFILTSPYGNAVVPINEILWIYKYSTLHKILWYHFSISYTLNICADKHLYIHCPKNTKSDIDGIMDYLAAANPDILVGFNEENRLKVQEVQGKPLHIEKWKAWLRRRV